MEAFLLHTHIFVLALTLKTTYIILVEELWLHRKMGD